MLIKMLLGKDVANAFNMAMKDWAKLNYYVQ